MATNVKTTEKAKAKTAAAKTDDSIKASTDSLAKLDAIKVDLQAVAAKLMDNEPKLGSPNRDEWESQIDKVDLAIARAKLAQLRAISSTFEQDVATLKTATGNLADQLTKLKKITDIVDAVSSSLGVLEKIIALGR